MIPLKAWIVWQLRKISYRWPGRYAIMKASQVAPNTFTCAGCKKAYKKLKGKRIISVDHIIPVKDPSRPGDFQRDIETCLCGVCDFLRKMFCDPSGLQMLCKICHDKKTKKETKQRVAKRKELK